MAALPDKRTAAPRSSSLILSLPVLPLSMASQRDGVTEHVLDARLGAVAFAVEQWGWRVAWGELRRFEGRLRLDLAHPRDTTLALTLDPQSAALSGDTGIPGLEAIVVGLPSSLRFRSSALEAQTDGWCLRGLLQLGGVIRLVSAMVRLVSSSQDAITGTEVVDVLASAEIPLAAFAPAAMPWLGAELELRVHARLERATSAAA